MDTKKERDGEGTKRETRGSVMVGEQMDRWEMSSVGVVADSQPMSAIAPKMDGVLPCG